MRMYFDLDDLHDSLLNKRVSDWIMHKTSQYIEDLAKNYGVAPEDIKNPTPFKVNQIAVYYALMTAALESSRMASNGEQDGADAYELKRRVYADMLKDLLDEISAETFTEGLSAPANPFPMSIKIHRS